MIEHDGLLPLFKTEFQPFPWLIAVKKQLDSKTNNYF